MSTRIPKAEEKRGYKIGPQQTLSEMRFLKKKRLEPEQDGESPNFSDNSFQEKTTEVVEESRKFFPEMNCRWSSVLKKVERLERMEMIEEEVSQEIPMFEKNKEWDEVMLDELKNFKERTNWLEKVNSSGDIGGLLEVVWSMSQDIMKMAMLLEGYRAMMVRHEIHLIENKQVLEAQTETIATLNKETIRLNSNSLYEVLKKVREVHVPVDEEEIIRRAVESLEQNKGYARINRYRKKERKNRDITEDILMAEEEIKKDKFVRGRRCFNCREVGHLKRDCKTERRCWHCAGTGHLGLDCPKMMKRCAVCKSDQHFAISCPNRKRCWGCEKIGHSWRTCPERKEIRPWKRLEGVPEERKMGEESVIAGACSLDEL